MVTSLAAPFVARAVNLSCRFQQYSCPARPNGSPFDYREQDKICLVFLVYPFLGMVMVATSLSVVELFIVLKYNEINESKKEVAT